MNVEEFLNSNNNTYRKLAYRFPYLVERAIDIRGYSIWETKITLANGEVYLFDDEKETVRKLPDKPENLNEDEFMCEFGIRLKNMMHRKRINQFQLSTLSGIPQPRISNYINGRTTPSIYTVNKLAKTLNCNIDELVY